jgi:hypothetical protein
MKGSKLQDLILQGAKIEEETKEYLRELVTRHDGDADTGRGRD